METRKQKIRRYIKEYEWSNVWAMIQNNKREPKICESNFTGKWVVITGATSGIGKETAKKYASKGANLLSVNRNIEKSEALKQEIESTYKVKCNYLIADLSIMEDTHRVANELAKVEHSIDVLIHNAGVFLTKRETTAEGIEKVWMVHYLSSFIITYKLREKLAEQDSARILLVNSEGHRFAVWGVRLDDINWEKRRYSGYGSYGAAKVAQILSLPMFTKFFGNDKITINAMHPGAVKSESGKDNGQSYQWFKRQLDKTLRPTEVASESLYYLGVSDEVSSTNAKFFNLTTLEEPTPPALDMEVAKELWQISLEMGQLNPS